MFLVASVAVSVLFPADHGVRSPGSSSPSQLLQTDLRWGSKADGTCVIDIFHRDGFASDAASFSAISRAAKRLDNACVAKRSQRVQGGWIRDIGMSISIYLPDVCIQISILLPVNYVVEYNVPPSATHSITHIAIAG